MPIKGTLPKSTTKQLKEDVERLGQEAEYYSDILSKTFVWLKTKLTEEQNLEFKEFLRKISNV